MNVVFAVCMILGCFLGAGFVSGREVSAYFSRFGYASIFSILLSTLLLFLLILFFLMLSSKADSFDCFVSIYFGKGKNIARVLFAMCVLIVTGSMFAGTRALTDDLHLNSAIVILATMVLCYLVLLSNVGGLKKANVVLVPLLLISLVIASIGHIGCVKISFENILSAGVSGVNYVFINIATLGMFLLEIGHEYSTKQKIIISAVTSLIIGAMLLILNFAIIGGGYENLTLPSLALVKTRPLLSVFMQISMYFGLFTTLISSVFLLSKYLNFLPYKLSILMSLVLGLAVSVLGFDMIVGYLYWVIGFVGVVMIIPAIFALTTNRKKKLPN